METKNQTKATAKGTADELEATKKAPELLEISELRTKHKIGKAIFAGVCTANDWRPGKKISEDDFLKAVTAFTGAPAYGSPRKESEAKK
ncbi:MAG: hypothetical protein ACOYJZ_01295 [Acutalibacter sp.]|jgi:hypothetical protein